MNEKDEVQTRLAMNHSLKKKNMKWDSHWVVSDFDLYPQVRQSH